MFRRKLYIVLPLVLTICGCTTTKDLTQGGRFGDRTTFSRGEIKMPANYNENNYRKMLMGVYIEGVQIDATYVANSRVQEIARELAPRLQTEMSKLRRFSIYSTFNRGGITFYKSLEDIGEVNMPTEVSRQDLDLLLNLKLKVSREYHERYNDDLYIYEVDIDANCEDIRTQKVKFSEKAKGQVRRAVKISLTGSRIGGYRLEDEQQAYMQAALRAVAIIANKLGNYFPVGGRVTSHRGDSLMLDRGFEQGVGRDMQMVVYVSIQGFPVPIAIAEAMPGENTSVLKIWRWNDEDKDAKTIIDDIRSSSEWLQKYDCHAVSLRMAVPPEWDRDINGEDRE